MKSLCDRFVAEDEQGIEAEVVAAKDTKTSAATSFDAAAGLAALTKHGIGLVTAHTLPNRRMVRKGGAGLQIRCVIGKRKEAGDEFTGMGCWRGDSRRVGAE